MCSLLTNWTSGEREQWNLRRIYKRENLTYAEECEAKLRLHELYQEKHGRRWRERKEVGELMRTAELLGDSIGETVQDLALARAIRENPKLAEKETKSAAYKAMRANEELDLRKKIAQVLADDEPKEERVKSNVRRFETDS